MKFNGFVGPSYNLKSVNVDSQRCVNLYPEIIESSTGKEAQVAYLKSTPGLKKIIETGSGSVRTIHVDPKGRVFLVIGSELYKTQYNGYVWETLKLGNFGTAKNPVKAASMFIGDDDATVFVDGTTNYLYLYVNSTSTESFGTFASYGYAPVDNASDIAFIDGYFIYAQKNSNQFFVSDLNSLAVDALSFASSEGSLDNIVGIMANHRDLMIFNERSVEVFSNTGNADFPFERISGGFSEKGCLSQGSIAKIDNNVFWIGRDDSGQGIVYVTQSLSPQRVSTHAVEQAISKDSNISNCTSFTYQKDGHLFYVLNLTDTTFVYDLSTRLWHERAYSMSGVLTRHKADCLGFVSGNNFSFHVVGDYNAAKVYVLDDETFTDDGTEITRLRICPHLSNGFKNLFYKSLQIDMETGIGLDAGVFGSDPQIMMSFSDDGGHSWSNELQAAIGKLGNYKTRVLWRRLGRSRDRVFKLKITDPVSVTILSAEIDVEVGIS